MKETNDILVKKLKKGNYSLVVDKNLQHLIGLAYGFHNRVMETFSRKDNTQYTESVSLLNAINKIVPTNPDSINSKKVTLEFDDIKTLNIWLKCVCQMIIELEHVDLKHKNIKKFFKLSDDFFKKTNIIEQLPSN